MSFATFADEGHTKDLAEINMVPLIDVMLVLLAIFIVAAPMLQHAVTIELPRAATSAAPVGGDRVRLAIDRSGQIHWDHQALSLAQLELRLLTTAAHGPNTELHLRADAATPYAPIAQVLAASARAGLTRIAFATDPHPQP